MCIQFFNILSLLYLGNALGIELKLSDTFGQRKGEGKEIQNWLWGKQRELNNFCL